MAPNDAPDLATDKDGIDKAELLDGSGQGIEFAFVDAARIGRVEDQRIDGNVLDRQRRPGIPRPRRRLGLYRSCAGQWDNPLQSLITS